MQIRQTAQARADLVDIWLRIAARDEATANRVLDDIALRVTQLAAYPELGKARPEIAHDARALVSERWLILYRITPGAVEVVRVVDGARDLLRLEF